MFNYKKINFNHICLFVYFSHLILCVYISIHSSIYPVCEGIELKSTLTPHFALNWIFSFSIYKLFFLTVMGLYSVLFLFCALHIKIYEEVRYSRHYYTKQN
jgi:hypothetical protein